ncbi:MAG: hypothetical protein JWO36_6387 [Myxococcales bacterium]|nr:hypothetical protein [Myxococcales bacterium]
MRKSILILSALALSAGVAAADHGRGGERGEHRQPVVQQRGNWNGGGGGRTWNGGGREWNGGGRAREWNGGSRGWSGGVNVTPNRGYENRRPVIVNRGFDRDRGERFERRPIYVNRPAIGYRYYNYYQRPSLLVENYAPVVGYIWIEGAWNWGGSEWIWQPGHYEPDPAYSGYDNTYYDGY